MTLSKRREGEGEERVCVWRVCVLDVKLHVGSRRMFLWLMMMMMMCRKVGARMAVEGRRQGQRCQTDGGMPNRTQAYNAPVDADAGEASFSARVQGLVFGSVRCGFVVVVRVGGV
jgi:hypothetical protein